jgi:hypothetical protein
MLLDSKFFEICIENYIKTLCNNLYMVCCVCKKPFIRSVDLTEYYQKKQEFDNKITRVIDSLTEEQLSTKNDEIWDTLLNYEALLLLPNYKPNKCNTEHCNSLICNYCYKHKGCVLCLDCSSPPLKS